MISSPPPLDRIDRQILGHLQNNARITNKELAAAVHLSPSSCHTRVRRLQDQGVIRGFHADIDPKALGIGIEALISVRLARHGGQTIEAFRSMATSLREVVEVLQVGGSEDAHVHVAVRDVEHLRNFVMTTFASWEDVSHIETALIFEHSRSPGLPDLTEDEVS